MDLCQRFFRNEQSQEVEWHGYLAAICVWSTVSLREKKETKTLR